MVETESEFGEIGDNLRGEGVRGLKNTGDGAEISASAPEHLAPHANVFTFWSQCNAVDEVGKLMAG